MFLMFVHLESTDVAGRLFADCLTGGTCSVVNAICRNNSCLCPRTHFAAFGQCGMYMYLCTA